VFPFNSLGNSDIGSSSSNIKKHVDIIQSGPKEVNTFEDMNCPDHVEKV
jgi:hypothetical protein